MKHLSISRLFVIKRLLNITVAVLTTVVVSTQTCSAEPPPIDPDTGLIIDKGFKTVDAYCVGCHTGKKIREHHATREGWQATILKMQQTGEWKFDAATEKLVLDYLSNNYPQP